MVAARQLYGDVEIAPCPFLPESIADLVTGAKLRQRLDLFLSR